MGGAPLGNLNAEKLSHDCNCYKIAFLAVAPRCANIEC